MTLFPVWNSSCQNRPCTHSEFSTTLTTIPFEFQHGCKADFHFTYEAKPKWFKLPKEITRQD